MESLPGGERNCPSLYSTRPMCCIRQLFFLVNDIEIWWIHLTQFSPLLFSPVVRRHSPLKPHKFPIWELWKVSFVYNKSLLAYTILLYHRPRQPYKILYTDFVYDVSKLLSERCIHCQWFHRILLYQYQYSTIRPRLVQMPLPGSGWIMVVRSRVVWFPLTERITSRHMGGDVHWRDSLFNLEEALKSSGSMVKQVSRMWKERIQNLDVVGDMNSRYCRQTWTHDVTTVKLPTEYSTTSVSRGCCIR